MLNSTASLENPNRVSLEASSDGGCFAQGYRFSKPAARLLNLTFRIGLPNASDHFFRIKEYYQAIGIAFSAVGVENVEK